MRMTGERTVKLSKFKVTSPSSDFKSALAAELLRFLSYDTEATRHLLANPLWTNDLINVLYSWSI